MLLPWLEVELSQTHAAVTARCVSAADGGLGQCELHVYDPYQVLPVWSGSAGGPLVCSPLTPGRTYTAVLRYAQLHDFGRVNVECRTIFTAFEESESTRLDDAQDVEEESMP